MTRAEASKLWPLIKAYGEGKTVQLNCNTAENPKWQDMSSLNFNCFPNSCRIKPEPKLRPWKPEEVPVGAWYKSSAGTIYIPVCKSEDGKLAFIGTSDSSQSAYWYSAYGLFNPSCGWLHSTDNGKTWHPCGVEE